jgi:hypothetical protein
MKKLLIAAWVVFALDLALLLLMVRELTSAELAEADREHAVSVVWTFGLWLVAVNGALIVGWWRDSRAILWVALVGGGLPLLWAWTLAVEALTEAAQSPR